jgi:hypothetical protein
LKSQRKVLDIAATVWRDKFLFLQILGGNARIDRGVTPLCHNRQSIIKNFLVYEGVKADR